MSNIVEKTKEKLVEYEKRHQAILNAAMRLFNAKGYAATTTASIAKEAGVTEKTMYRHFKNKEVLFGACVSSITEDIAALWQDALVMSDVETNSLWPQILGECAQGKMENSKHRA